MTVGIVYDSYMLNHKAFSDHVENPSRITSIYAHLMSLPLFKNLLHIKSRICSTDELQLAHSNKYIRDITSKLSAPSKLRDSYMLEFGDIYANEYTLDAAKTAVGCSLALTKEVIKNKVTHGFAIVRPPGHHATTNKAMGLCFFNNIAISAMYARKNNKKVCIIDWDIHHGNGTEKILNDQKADDVLFISIHKYSKGYYPGTGKSSENNNRINIGIDGKMDDNSYLTIIKENVIPRIKNFGPDIVFISAGFDAGIDDPIGTFEITPNCFGEMTRQIKNETPHIVMILEGGYNLIYLPIHTEMCIKSLMED